MITPEIRIELLRIARPGVPNPDVDIWIESAKKLEGYVVGLGQPSKEAPTAAARSQPEDRNNRQSPGPAHRK